VKAVSVLIVDDEQGIRHGLENLFRREGFSVHSAADFESSVAQAAAVPVDVAIVDLRLRTGKSGLELLADLKRLEPDIIVIVITGYGSIDTAVASLKGGAADYLLKPIDNVRLLATVRRNLELRSLKSENRFLKDELSRRCLPDRFVTGDPAMRELLEKADKVKDSPVTVLISGESGTGKEVLARYIHYTSKRREAGFIGINCAALSESLLLSELFGHERGAFTGAVERKRGRFELADGGTLFLDEIGDMSPEVQAKLLRVIEENSFERLGGVKKITVDARIIAATNRDLTELIRKGAFREDLYYRVNVVSLNLTPLRERRADVPLLVEHLLDKYTERYGRERPRLGRDTMAALEGYDWPGNVRELENLVNQIVLLGENALTAWSALRGSISSGVTAGAPGGPAGSPCAPVDPSGVTSLKDALETVVAHFERQIVRECLERNRGNKSRTARELAVTRRTLARKIEKYGLQGPAATR
jgi:two-component system response regulator AtoC